MIILALSVTYNADAEVRILSVQNKWINSAHLKEYAATVQSGGKWYVQLQVIPQVYNASSTLSWKCSDQVSANILRDQINVWIAGFVDIL